MTRHEIKNLKRFALCVGVATSIVALGLISILKYADKIDSNPTIEFIGFVGCFFVGGMFYLYKKAIGDL